MLLDKVKNGLELPKDASNREEVFQDIKDKTTKWVAKYRREGSFQGRPSYRQGKKKELQPTCIRHMYCVDSFRHWFACDARSSPSKMMWAIDSCIQQSVLVFCSTTYSAVNALAGHFNSFGLTAPVPKKRLDRIQKVIVFYPAWLFLRASRLCILCMGSST